MKINILNAIKVSSLAIVLSFGLSYAYAWTAPTAIPPTGNVEAPINTSAAAQAKVGSLGIGMTTAPDTSLHIRPSGGTEFTEGLKIERGTVPTQYGIFNQVGGWIRLISTVEGGGGYGGFVFGASNNGSTEVERMRINETGNVGIGTTAPVAKLDVQGTIKGSGGYVGNGPIPLTPHYVNRSEDTYGGAFNYHQYCNGWSPHDTCNGDYNNPFTCSKSTNIASCTDTYPTPMPRVDFGWCGSYFYDRTVICNTNEVLSTYDDNI